MRVLDVVLLLAVARVFGVVLFLFVLLVFGFILLPGVVWVSLAGCGAGVRQRVGGGGAAG